MITIHAINDLSHTYVISMLTASLSKITDPDIIKNYHPDYRTIKGNLFQILEDKKGRYKKGNYYVIEGDGNYIGSAGWNEYNDVALLCTRAYLMPGYRHRFLMSKYLLPRMFKETENYDKLWFTFNDHNVPIYETLSKLSKKNDLISDTKSPLRKNYSNFKPIGQRQVYSVIQHVLEYDKSK
jgi:hypothetical protein